MFILLFLLWILFNGRVTAEIAVFGLALTTAMEILYLRLVNRGAERAAYLLRLVPALARYGAALLWETVKAAVAVAKLALTPGAHPEPVLVEFHSGLERESLNVLLANSITLTPGTITVFQEGDRFLVHALRREYAQGLEDSVFVRLLRRFPT